MFDVSNILKMMGVNPDTYGQFMAVKQHLDLLPIEKQQEIVGSFVNELKKAVEEAQKDVEG